MTDEQVLVGHLVQLALAAALLGLVRSGRWRSCVLFSAYLGAALACNTLVFSWPSRFYVYRFWMAKEVTYAVLLLGSAVEIAWRTFRPFRGVAFERVGVAILTITTVLVVMAPAASTAYLTVAAELLPRASNGTLWLLLATVAFAHWYRVPFDPLHRAIIATLGVYLLLSGTFLRLVGIYGWGVQPYLNAVVPAAYLAAAAWWAYRAWHPDQAGERNRAAVLTLARTAGVP